MKRLNLIILVVFAISLSSCVHYAPNAGIETERSHPNKPLKEQLLKAKAEYQNQDELFIIDVIYKDASVLQILRRQMLEDVNDQQFGFGIHLNFNLQQAEELQQLLLFHKLPVLDLFTLYEVINSPTFQIDLNEDLDRIEAMTYMLLKTVYTNDKSAIRFELSDMAYPAFFDIPDNLSKESGPSKQVSY